MRLIGDIHGEIYQYEQIINGANESVQVGDFGIGFLNDPQMEFVTQMHADGRHKFIRGNHDDPDLCKEQPGYIADGTYDKERGIMYVGGAWSIDWKWRTPGFTWWDNEELSDAEFDLINAEYMQWRPKIMVTHDCPTQVAYELFIKNKNKAQYKTRTAEHLQTMFDGHQPDIWLFGHWHEDHDVVINGTRFICLGINSYIDLVV